MDHLNLTTTYALSYTHTCSILYGALHPSPIEFKSKFLIHLLMVSEYGGLDLLDVAFKVNGLWVDHVHHLGLVAHVTDGKHLKQPIKIMMKTYSYRVYHFNEHVDM